MDKKILIIEDDIVIQEIISRKFAKNGFKVLLANDAFEAENILNSTIPNAILLDILLPKVSGLEILKKVRANPKTKAIPVVVFSNLGSVEEIQQAIDLGATDYMVKADHTTEEVMHRVNQILVD